MRRKPWHWPNHIELYPNINKTSSKDNTDKDNTDTKNILDGNDRRRRRLSGHQSLQKSFVGYQVLDWKTFVQRPMHLSFVKNEYNEEDNNDDDVTAMLCQKGLPIGYVSPCHRNRTFIPQSLRERIPRSFLRHLPFDVNDPVYEMDLMSSSSSSSSSNRSNSLPYQHPMDIRAAKLHSMLAIPTRWHLAGFAVVNYESLENEGMDALIDGLSAAIGIHSQKTTGQLCPVDTSFARQQTYNLSRDFQDWIDNHTNWELETMMGYDRRRAAEHGVHQTNRMQ
jgi:hypothetical protein